MQRCNENGLWEDFRIHRGPLAEGRQSAGALKLTLKGTNTSRICEDFSDKIHGFVKIFTLPLVNQNGKEEEPACKNTAETPATELNLPASSLA